MLFISEAKLTDLWLMPFPNQATSHSGGTHKFIIVQSPSGLIMFVVTLDCIVDMACAIYKFGSKRDEFAY